MNFNFPAQKNSNAQKKINQRYQLQLQLQRAKMLSKTLNQSKKTTDVNNKEKIIANVEATIKCIDDNTPEIINLTSMKDEILNNENLDNLSQNEHMTKLIKLINKILDIDDDVFFYNLIKDNSEYPGVKMYNVVTFDNNFINMLKNESDIYYPNLLTIKDGNNLLTIKDTNIDANKDTNNIVLDIKNSDTIKDNNIECTNQYINNEENLESEREIKNEMPKKSCIDYNRIKKIQNEDIFTKEISTNDLLSKMNNMVKKVYKKLEIEISKDAVNYSDILSNKNTKNNITNIICSIILDKIDKLLN